MTKKYLLAAFIVSVLVTIILGMSGIVDASSLTFGRATDRPTRDLTEKPRKTKTSEPAAQETVTPEATPVVDVEALAAGALSSQVLVLNSDRGGTARVSIDVYDDAGGVAFSDTFKLKQNGAKVVTLPKAVGVDFMGSARVVADRRVQALVLDANGDGTASDAYEVVRGGSNTLTLPYLRHLALATQNSLIAIQNTSSVATNATLTAYDVAGSVILAHPVGIPPRASVYLKTDDLFGATAFVGSAVITADQPLAAAELTTYKQDTASLRAYTVQDEGTRLVAPGVERKRNKKDTLTAWNELYVRNNGAAAADIKVEYYSQKGDKTGTITRTNIPAGGLAMFDTSTAEFQFLGKKFVGWASVESTGDTPIVVHSLAAQGRGKQFVGVGGVARPQINGRSVCGSVSTSAKVRSTLTLSNPRGKEDAVVRVRLYDREEGAQVSDFNVAVKSNAQAKITTENGLPTNFQGIALVGVDGGDSRSIIAMVTTQTLNGKRVQSTSGYVCR